jgi:hypothetical protein
MSGTAAAASTLSVTGPSSDPGGLQLLERWSVRLRDKGSCALPDGLARVLQTLVTNYPDEVQEHLLFGRQDKGFHLWRHLTLGSDSPLQRPVAADSAAVPG